MAYREAGDVRDVIGEADVIYMEPVVQADYTASRVERGDETGLTPPEYVVTRELLREKAKRSSIILHSLPRMDELPEDVDATRHQRYWVEAFNGVVPADGAPRARPRRGRVGARPCRRTCAAATSSASRSGRRRRSTPSSRSPLQLKRERALGIPHPLLRDRVLAMLFFFSSTRTRASFEAGMAQLGGHAQFIESRTTQIAHGDTPKEIGEILGRYNDGIAIRNVDWGVGNRYIREVAAASRVPVLNMQCDLFHPHQSLADLLTILEKKGDPRGRTIAISWAYAASYQKPISVPVDLSLLTTRYGMNVRLVHPPEFRLPADIVDQAAENARRSGGIVRADGRLRRRDDAAPTSSTPRAGAPCSRRRTRPRAPRSPSSTPTGSPTSGGSALAAEDAIYMHPLPADRGIEVADAVIDGPHSVVYDEAENRLHAQKAVMALTMR